MVIGYYLYIMKEAIQKAAELWADQIVNGVQDNGEPMQSMFAQMLKKSCKEISKEHLDKFKEIFEKILEVELLQRNRVILSVDYHPAQILEKCCIASGINTSTLPIKSIMWITENSVAYKFGYTAQIETINF